MIRLLLAMLLAYIPAAYAKVNLVYQNNSWQVISVDRKDREANCLIISRSSPVHNGYTYLAIFPNNLLFYTGEDIDGYFEQANKVTLYSGGRGNEIPSQTMVSAINIVQDLLAHKTDNVKIEIQFDDRTDTHLFPVNGFQQAHARHLECIQNALERKNTAVTIVTIEPGDTF